MPIEALVQICGLVGHSVGAPVFQADGTAVQMAFTEANIQIARYTSDPSNIYNTYQHGRPGINVRAI